MKRPAEIYRKLEREFLKLALHRPMRVGRLEPGTELVYDVIGVPANRGRVRLMVEAFVGGGFAGQVYRVSVLDIESASGPIGGLERGKVFAMKILIPPSLFSRLFRNTLYWLGFQGPFQLQVNPAAARAGALWQKFIRRGARVWFGDERAVVDIHATFVDSKLGSCGELSEWVEGRTWRLEVDEQMDRLKRWRRGKEVDAEGLGSPEYRAKYVFMRAFVDLLHAMGAHEFARQYEWSTWKSQPNCLKRSGTEDSPSEGLVAVDFRAGLALLPFLPMSPGDVKLIVQGIRRGSLVQFDRGDLGRLEHFVEEHADVFADMHPMLDELRENEGVYRESVPDIAHNHVRLLYSARLWSTVLSSFVTGWRTRGMINETCEKGLRNSRIRTLLFCVLGMIPWLGRRLRRIWGQPYWRAHYRGVSTSWDYLRRSLRGKFIERVIVWHRSERVADGRADRLVGQPWRCLYHLPFSILPAGLHRFLTDWQYAKNRLDYVALRPVRLYFNEERRTQWLRDMVTEGREKHLLTDEDADAVLSQIGEPFIQKYLKSLAVHVCTLPVTQVVSLLVAIIYIARHPEMPRGQAYAIGVGILALFQVVPISPGSLTRGLYVVYLVIRDRSFKDYNIAVFLGFFKYIGYLAFPIQMTYRYPALAGFMAGHWATEAVHIVPVFGERGALLEHYVFRLFYNWPLTIRRRMRTRSRIRAALRPRYWHIALCALVGTGMFGGAEFVYVRRLGELPGLREIWALALIVPLLCGVVVTLGAGGAAFWKRVVGGVVCGGAVGVLYTAASAMSVYGESMGVGGVVATGVWRIFVFAILSTVGVLLTEIGLPERQPAPVHTRRPGKRDE